MIMIMIMIMMMIMIMVMIMIFLTSRICDSSSSCSVTEKPTDTHYLRNFYDGFPKFLLDIIISRCRTIVCRCILLCFLEDLGWVQSYLILVYKGSGENWMAVFFVFPSQRGIVWHAANFKINSQSLEDTQVGYISQKYSFDKNTFGRAFKPSYTFLNI